MSVRLLSLSASRAPHFKKDSEKLVSIQWKMMRTVVRTEAMSYEQWLQELCLAWRRRSRGDIRAAFKYLKGCHKEEEFKHVLCGSKGETRAIEVASIHLGVMEKSRWNTV